MLYSSSVCQNIHPAAAPSIMPSTVMTVGCTPSFFHSSVNTSPMGRVKYTSSHSSVSLDFIDACSISLNVAISFIFLCSFVIYIGL